MKTYEFTYVLVGRGETEDEAHEDALEAFWPVNGEPISIKVLEEEENESLSYAHHPVHS